MKRRSRRMLAMILAASMTLTMMPATVFASIEGMDESKEMDMQEVSNSVGLEENSEDGLTPLTTENFVEAPIVDASDPTFSVYDDFNVESEATNEHFDVTMYIHGLRYHINKDGVGGYWAGFAVKAPENAEKVTYTFNGVTKELEDLEETVDGTGKRGITFYYDLDGRNGDIVPLGQITITFFGSDNRQITPETVVDVNELSYIEKIVLHDSGFTYDKTEGGLPPYSLYTTLENINGASGEYDILNQKYIVVLSEPEDSNSKYSCYIVDANMDILSDSRTIYWKYNENVPRGTYEISLYTYAGSRLTSEDEVEISEEGIPSSEAGQRIFKRVCDSEVNVCGMDEITSIDVEFSADETASGYLDTDYSINDGDPRDIVTIVGKVANMEGNRLEVDLTLQPSNITKHVTLNYDPKDGENGSWSSDPLSIQLFSSDVPLQIKCDIKILPARILKPGEPVVRVDADKESEWKDVIENLKRIKVSYDSESSLENILATYVIDETLKNRDINKDMEELREKTKDTVTKETFHYVAQPYLIVELQNYNETAKEMQLNIRAVYDLIASISTEGDLVYEGDGTNAVILESELEIDESVYCDLDIPVPNDFFGLSSGDTETRYVECIGSGKKNFYIDGYAETCDGKTTLRLDMFRLGTFVMKGSPMKMEAKFHDESYYYLKLEDAIADLSDPEHMVDDANEIEILTECTDKFILNRPVIFSLYYKPGYYDISNIVPDSGYEFEPGYPLTETAEKDGMLVTYFNIREKASSDIPSSSGPNTPTTPDTPTPTPSITPEPSDTPEPSAPQDIEFVDPRQEKGLLERTSGSKNCHLNLEMNVEGEDFTFAYTSSDPDVATVTDDGVIRYQGVGETTVTVTATDADGRIYTREITVRVTQPGQPTFTPSNNISKESKTITVTTSTVRGADGFQVQYSLKNLKKTRKGAKKVNFVSDEKAIRRKIETNKSGAKYYIRVRAYQIVDGKKVYSDWSPVKSMKSR